MDGWMDGRFYDIYQLLMKLQGAFLRLLFVPGRQGCNHRVVEGRASLELLKGLKENNPAMSDGDLKFKPTHCCFPLIYSYVLAHWFLHQKISLICGPILAHFVALHIIPLW